MPIKAKYARMRSAAQVHVQQSKQDTGPDKASHTESPRVEVSAGGGKCREREQQQEQHNF